MGHQIVCSLHDSARAAPILNELEKLGFEVFAKGRYLPVAGAGPLVDDLIIVSDRKYVAEVIAGQESNQAILCRRRILKLINHPIRIRLANSRGYRRHLVREAAGIENHPIEVHDVTVA